MMSLDRTYNPRTLDDLAALVASTRTGIQPSWQIPGIKAALIQAANRDGTITLGQLAHAALTVALDPNAKTPQRIAHDGPWWNITKLGTSDSASATIRPLTDTDCAICNRPRELCLRDGHEYAAHADYGFGTPMPDTVRERLAEVAEATHLAATAEREAEIEKAAPAPAAEVIAKHADHPHQPTQEPT